MRLVDYNCRIKCINHICMYSQTVHRHLKLVETTVDSVHRWKTDTHRHSPGYLLKKKHHECICVKLSAQQQHNNFWILYKCVTNCSLNTFTHVPNRAFSPSTHTRMSRLWHPAGQLVGPCPRSPAPVCHVRRCPPPEAAWAPSTGYVATLCSYSTEAEDKAEACEFIRKRLREKVKHKW